MECVASWGKGRKVILFYGLSRSSLITYWVTEADRQCLTEMEQLEVSNRVLSVRQ